MNCINAINAKEKKFCRRLENEAKKTNKNVKFYYYLKLIKTFKRAAFALRFY